MKNLRGAILSLSFVLLCCLPVLSAEQKQAPDDLIAKVGKIAITQQDLERELNRLIPMNASFHGGVKQETIDRLRAEARQNLIDRAYKVQYAIDEEIAVDQQSLDSQWQAYTQKNARALAAVPEEALAKMKADQYLTLLAEKAEQDAVEQKVVVSEEKVKSYYQENKERFLKPKSYTASHILVKVDPASAKEEKDQRKKRAEELFARAQSGEDFYNLAYYESDDRSKYVGGSLGTFHAGQTVSEFDAAIQKMQAGDIAGPIQTLYGYHIIKLDKVEEQRQLSFEEAAVGIRETMKKDLRDNLYNAWMETLKNKYPLEEYESAK